MIRARPESRRLRVAALGIACALAAACDDPPYREVSFLETLRVLAIRAEPAEVAPGVATQLSALVVDPRAPSRQNTLLWMACDPDPKALDQPACAQFSTFDDTSQLGAATTLPDGVRQIGFGSSASYQASADLFASLTPDDPLRQKGVLAIVLLVAVAQPPPQTSDEIQALMDKVKNKQVDAVFALKRVRISENPAPNHNPVMEDVQIDTQLWGAEPVPAKVRPDRQTVMVGRATSTSAESYVAPDVDGHPVQQQERLAISWFADVGTFYAARTMEGESQGYALSDRDRMPADRRAALYTVLRDSRGGVDWMLQPIFFCDPLVSAPTVTGIEPAVVDSGGPITIRGTGMDQVLDVWFVDFFNGEGGTLPGAYDPQQDAWSGTLPSFGPEAVPMVKVRGRSCDEDAGWIRLTRQP